MITDDERRELAARLRELDYADLQESLICAYLDAAARFKAKWMHRTPRNRVEFYQNKLQDYADRLKREMGEV